MEGTHVKLKKVNNTMMMIIESKLDDKGITIEGKQWEL